MGVRFFSFIQAIPAFKKGYLQSTLIGIAGGIRCVDMGMFSTRIVMEAIWVK